MRKLVSTKAQVLIVVLGTVLLAGLWWSKASRQVVAPAVTACDLNQGACEAVTGSGRVTLSIAPRPIRPLKPLQAEVRLQGIEAERVALLFTGVDVDMGRLFYPLERVDEGYFAGQVSLSICSKGHMTWQALVVIDDTLHLPFRFDSEYKSQFTIIE